jgi:hypothetical protein
MFNTLTHPVAEPYVPPTETHALIQLLGGLGGAALAIAIFGAAIGFIASSVNGRLPAAVTVPLGILGAFVVAAVI